MIQQENKQETETLNNKSIGSSNISPTGFKTGLKGIVVEVCDICKSQEGEEWVYNDTDKKSVLICSDCNNDLGLDIERGKTKMQELEMNQSKAEKKMIVFDNMLKEINRIDRVTETANKENKEFSEIEENREPLSIDKEEIVKILLSWGGGEDGFKLTFQDKQLISGVYYMADWGVYQETELNEESLDKVYNFYLFGEYPNN